jgi:hypothetical protein
MRERIELDIEGSKQNTLRFRHSIVADVRGVPFTVVATVDVDALTLGSGRMTAAASVRQYFDESRKELLAGLEKARSSEATGGAL